LNHSCRPSTVLCYLVNALARSLASCCVPSSAHMYNLIHSVRDL